MYSFCCSQCPCASPDPSCPVTPIVLIQSTPSGGCGFLLVTCVECIPVFDTTNFGSNPLEIQNVPCNSVTILNDYCIQDEGQRLWQMKETRLISTLSKNSCTKVPYYCLNHPSSFSSSNWSHGGGAEYNRQLFEMVWGMCHHHSWSAMPTKKIQIFVRVVLLW